MACESNLSVIKLQFKMPIRKGPFLAVIPAIFWAGIHFASAANQRISHGFTLIDTDKNLMGKTIEGKMIKNKDSIDLNRFDHFFKIRVSSVSIRG